MSDENHPLTPVQENPWYILATLAGEQTDGYISEHLHRRNHILWNRWATQNLDDAEIEDLLKTDAIQKEDIEHSKIDDIIEKAKARNLSSLPEPDNQIDFSYTEWIMPAAFTGFIFRELANFQGVTFRELANFQSATFSEWADFHASTFMDDAHFQNATFRNAAYIHSVTFRE